MIRKLLLSSVTLVVISGTAFAADLPSRRAPPVYIPPPIPVFSWTGAYVGAQVGYAFGRDNATLFPTLAPAFGVGIGQSPNGIIGGGHVGYNFSTQSLGFNAVYGIEGDVDGSDYHRQQAFGALFGNRTSNTIQGSIRGRLGIAFDRALFYATGGAAFAGFNTNYVTFGAPDNFSRTRVGYTVGGGLEYAVTNNLSLRGEYRYSDFGSFTDVLLNGSAGLLSVRHKETEQRAQVGFSYKFDTLAPAPVVARY